jgi:tetratricopeptide (TPR) repeat protein
VRGCACRGTAGLAHVSCLAEQAKILFAEAEENNLNDKDREERWRRWNTCSLCEQRYHGVVSCALGWACWKTYLGRPELDKTRLSAMGTLGNGLADSQQHEDSLSVRQAVLSMLRRLGAPEHNILIAQTCLANSHTQLGRHEEAVLVYREAYSGYLRFNGEEHGTTLLAATNYAKSLLFLKHFEEAKALLRKTMPVARRVLGEDSDTTLRMRTNYAAALVNNADATLDDLREGVTMLEDADRTARRVLGGAHPLTTAIESGLLNSRAMLRDRETMGDVSSLREAMEAMTSGDA